METEETKPALELGEATEAKKREESLKKSLGVEKQCVSDLEKALHEMRSEVAQIKFISKSLLALARGMACEWEHCDLPVGPVQSYLQNNIVDVAGVDFVDFMDENNHRKLPIRSDKLVSVSRDREGVSCVENGVGGSAGKAIVEAPQRNSLDRNGRFASTMATMVEPSGYSTRVMHGFEINPQQGFLDKLPRRGSGLRREVELPSRSSAGNRWRWSDHKDLAHATVNCSDMRRRTPLHVVVASGNSLTIQGILKIGVEANGMKDSGRATVFFCGC
ncbi:hypothetical protein SUGI_1137000 [Cryptomeria japonica]|nr:hypothetical protein SUGI_1137000 [Cryptomeria japonica]